MRDGLYRFKVVFGGYIFIHIVNIVRLFGPLRFLTLLDDRVGHYIAEVEYYLRKKKLDQNYGTSWDILLCGNRPANHTLVEMTRRYMTVLCCDVLKSLCLAARTLKPDHPAFVDMPHVVYDPDVFDNTQTPFQLSLEQLERGKALLAEMGIPENGKLICFAVRDEAYLKHTGGGAVEESSDYHNYRNPDLIQYVKMAEKFAEDGYWLVRMGAVTEKPLNTRHPRIIDYSTKYRSDFGDVYLSATCKLFVADSSGIVRLSQNHGGFGVRGNLNMYDIFTPWPHFMSIPVRYLDVDSGKILTYGEAISRGVSEYCTSAHFSNGKIKIIYNSSEELIEAVQEMFDRIENENVTTEEYLAVENEFISLFPEGYQNRFEGYRSPVSVTFLKRHRCLLS